MKKRLRLTDFSKGTNSQLVEIDIHDLVQLPIPYDSVTEQPWEKITEEQKTRLVCNLDGIVALALPRPQNTEEETRCVELFGTGMKKLLTQANNWTFLQPLLLSLEYCAQCQTCNDACPIYVGSGKNDLYRPTYRSEIFRRLVDKYARSLGKLRSKLKGDVALNWTTISRLYELSYRCTLCRRCAQVCPMGVDNALIAREMRKVFSQELDWAPKELHEKGTVLQLEVGSPTAMQPHIAKDNIEFLDDDFTETLGIEVSTPWDKAGADILLLHSAGDIMAWPESVIAFTILCNAAGVDWTLSSELHGYDGVNYGLFYDDIQFVKIALSQVQAARKLGVRKIVMGECGHQHKSSMAVSDRILTGDLEIPRESVMVFLEHLVFSGKIRFDPSRNNFPVTLHDPCNIVRSLGIVEPQRRILRYLCPQFREMTPHGVDNYCCGGGGGLSVISETNFPDWRVRIGGRVKFSQILEAFKDQPGPEVRKYICAPCLNCKIQFRDMLTHYRARERSGIICGGLAELIVNAMVDITEPFIQWGETVEQ